MYFGTEFFVCFYHFFDINTDFSGEIELEIPDNLFDLEIPVFIANDCGIQNDPDIFFGLESDFNFQADLFSDVLQNFFSKIIDIPGIEKSIFFNLQNIFFDREKLLENYEIFRNFYGFISRDLLENSMLSDGFGSGFTEYLEITGKPFSRELKSFESSRNFLRRFDEFFKFSEFDCGNFSEFIDHYEAFSEKNSELFEFSHSRFSDQFRSGLADDAGYRIKKPELDSEKISVPNNIFSLSASTKFGGKNIENTHLEKDNENLSNRFTRRIERLEEIICSEKKNYGLSVETVIRKIDHELRSALNSCCEGVHF